MLTALVLAQAGPTESGLVSLLDRGVLGVLCVLLIGAIVWLVKAWKASMEGRITDAKAFGDALKPLNDSLSDLTRQNQTSLSSLDTKLTDHDSRCKKAHDSATDEIEAMKKEHAGIKTMALALGQDHEEILKRVKGR